MVQGRDWFSSDYLESRRRFRELATAAGAHQEALEIGVDGPDGASLTIDMAWLGPRDAKRIVVVSSGIHGVEGFMGGAAQLSLLATLPERRDDIAFVLLHALNPYGFAFVRRVSEANVDLNRNFLLHGEAYTGAPEGYDRFDPILNPERPLQGLSPQVFLARAAFLMARTGLEKAKGIVAGGQYIYPKGLFFGGSEKSNTLTTLEQAVPSWFSGAEKLLMIDFHTGLGEPATYKLLSDRQRGTVRCDWLIANFGAEIEPWNDGVAYAIRGGLGTWMQATLPEVELDVLAAEFGTVKPLAVITALHCENRAHHYGDPSDRTYIAAKRRMMATFAPPDPTWRDTVVARGRHIVEQALAAV